MKILLHIKNYKLKMIHQTMCWFKDKEVTKYSNNQYYKIVGKSKNM